MQTKSIEKLKSLVNWYLLNARDMPWRSDPTAYRVLVSEMMLQQTQVTTVIPYFESFVERFPSFQELADASESDVLAAWSGLGYYRRARLLHAAAKEVAVNLNGQLPSSRASLLGLPGIGKYTASAVASLAFREPVGVVDGNVERVLSRLFLIEAPIKSKASQQFLQDTMDSWARLFDSSTLNQAVMELGATVCKKQTPLCASCPVSSECRARAVHRIQEVPVLSKPKKAVALSGFIGLAITPKGDVLLSDAPTPPLGSEGIHELPVFWSSSLEEFMSWLVQNFQLSPNSVTSLPTLKHSKTVYRMELTPIRIEVANRSRRGVWTTRSSLDNKKIAISGLTKKALRAAHDKLG